MKKVLIIGSRGYIGSALELHLSKRPDLVVDGLDMCIFNPSKPNTIVIDYNKLSEEFIRSYNVVILLAGHSSIKMCEGEFINSYNNNVRNFLNLLSKIDNSSKFIYASSSSIYGKINYLAKEEDTNFIPYNNYDITKYIIDISIDRFDIEYYGLRFGTVNGYSPLIRKDLMINSMYMSANEVGEIQLFNKNIMRPILGMTDLIKSIEKIIDSDVDNRGIYNMASFNKTAEEIAYEVGEIFNIPINEIEKNTTSIVTYDFGIDSSKFEKTFDFKFTDTILKIVTKLRNSEFLSTVRDEKFKYE